MAKKNEKTLPSGATRFEDAMAELEGMVRRLEQGELPLEESLAAFERGMALVQDLTKRLEDVERRVEVLVRREDGVVGEVPFDDADDEG